MNLLEFKKRLKYSAIATFISVYSIFWLSFALGFTCALFLEEETSSLVIQKIGKLGGVTLISYQLYLVPFTIGGLLSNQTNLANLED